MESVHQAVALPLEALSVPQHPALIAQQLLALIALQPQLQQPQQQRLVLQWEETSVETPPTVSARPAAPPTPASPSAPGPPPARDPPWLLERPATVVAPQWEPAPQVCCAWTECVRRITPPVLSQSSPR